MSENIRNTLNRNNEYNKSKILDGMKIPSKTHGYRTTKKIIGKQYSHQRKNRMIGNNPHLNNILQY